MQLFLKVNKQTIILRPIVAVPDFFLKKCFVKGVKGTRKTSTPPWSVLRSEIWPSKHPRMQKNLLLNTNFNLTHTNLYFDWDVCLAWVTNRL